MLAAILTSLSHDCPVNCDVNSFSLWTRCSLRDCGGSGWSADSGCLVGDLQITSTRGTHWKKTPHTDLSSQFVFFNKILSLTARCETVEVDWTVIRFYCIQSVSTCRGANGSQQLSAVSDWCQHKYKQCTLTNEQTLCSGANNKMSSLGASSVFSL